MGLTRIRDLNGPVDEVRELIQTAKQLSLLYDAYCNREEPDDGSRAPGIHASELTPCLRRGVYTLINYPKRSKSTKFWRQRFKVGHALHAAIQKDFHTIAELSKKAKKDAFSFAKGLAFERGWTVEFESEVKLAPGLQELSTRYNLHSSADGVFTFYAHGQPVLRVLLEIKTESPQNYEKLTKPKQEHLEQVHMYMAALDIPLTWFFYFSKGTQNNTSSEWPYLLPFDPAIWAVVEQRCQTALAHQAAGTLPEPEPTILCEFCPYAYACRPQPAYVEKNPVDPATVFRSISRKVQ